ncbi:MAG: hypothetical protein DRO87_11855 [Candidatus Thorarchaeota archaeon]|nr:MAG: hypothetical protein DRO87_11855 [Candidatus Thorarchaeota archaeon]RLI58284.1 MAG: hypothetical protein DRP09_00685 [Candidatus Thorarchaeota archaeon]
MSTDVDSKAPSVVEAPILRRDVAEFIRRVRIGFALSEECGPPILVHDKALQLGALFSQAGFILTRVLSNFPSIRWSEMSLHTTPAQTQGGFYSVDGVSIDLRAKRSDLTRTRLDKWIRDSDVNLCGNVHVSEEKGVLRIFLRPLP